MGKLRACQTLIRSVPSSRGTRAEGEVRDGAGEDGLPGAGHELVYGPSQLNQEHNTSASQPIHIHL